jgi:hypothetical protein
LGPKASAPTLDNDGNALLIGALYFNTTTNAMQVYGSSGWTAAGSSVNGTSRRYRYIATAAQTTFTGADSNGFTLAYDAGYVDVYLNGVRLDSTDFTASSGTSIVLASAAAAGDELNIVAFGTFVLADHYSKTDADARYVRKDSATGAATIPVGTTAQRPASPQNGDFRVNTTTQQTEVYYSGAWAAVSSLNYLVEFLVVAGGGGTANGGGSEGSGGGGAGGYIASSANMIPLSAYTVTVGAGGSGSTTSAPGGVGSNSVFNTTTATGGGNGGRGTSASGVIGGNGGSGGGSGAYYTAAGGSGTSGQGNNGGAGNSGSPSYTGGGGGGAGAAGSNGGLAGGNGGIGANWQSLGTYYAGGGGGGAHPSGSAGGTGGAGGGGNGGLNTSGTAGTANTGGGGGGSGGSANGANGGSGVVIIRYPGVQRGTGGTVTSSGGYTYHTFTSSGTFTA